MASSCESTATSPPPPKRVLRQVARWGCYAGLYTLAATTIAWAAAETALECGGVATIGQWIVIIQKNGSASRSDI